METNLKNKAEAKPIFKVTDKASGGSQKTSDGFQNFVARLGVSARGNECSVDNLLTHGHYQFNLVTRNRIALEAAYRGSWIVGQVIDTIAEDMTRAGIIITSNDGAKDVPKIQVQLKRQNIFGATRDTISWARLYGGAVAVMQIKGQKLDTPIDLDTVGKDQFLGLVVYDRWQLYPALDRLIQDGPDLGLPEFYDVVLGSNMNDPGQEPGGQMTTNATGRVRIHHSRLLRGIGIQLPFFQAITEMLWGESVLERMWDRLIAFDDASLATGNLINRAQLRTVGIEGLREILAAGGPAQEALVAQFDYMRQLQSNEGITLLDKNDMFQSTAYSFAGLSDVLIQFGQQVSGAAQIPLVRLFGQSPAGMNSTGEADIRLYYDSILAKQESGLRNFFEILLKVMWRSTTGKPAPEDMAFTFTPLWQMSATDKANVAKTNTDTLVEAHQEGAIDTATLMRELKQNSAETGLFTHITDEAIEEAENEEPPVPGGENGIENELKNGDPTAPEIPGEATGEPGASKDKNNSSNFGKETQLTGADSVWQKIRDWLSGKAQDKGSEKISQAPAEKKAPKLSKDQARIQDFLNRK